MSQITQGERPPNNPPCLVENVSDDAGRRSQRAESREI